MSTPRIRDAMMHLVRAAFNEDKAVQLRLHGNTVTISRVRPEPTADYPAGRCPYHSRAYGARCELAAGHGGDVCVSAGDGFKGLDPRPGGARDDQLGVIEVTMIRCAC